MLTIFPQPESFIGKEIDGYRIDAVLGNGGMGIVFKATQIELSRQVALKIINPTHAQNESFLRRFKSEARALASIHHPNIVTIYNFRPFEQGLYIAMEYVHGSTLASYISEMGKLEWPESLSLAKQVLSALDYTHSLGIIHRDIKPSNILLDKNKVVKISDFGLVKIVQGDSSSSDATLSMHTGGTLCYMPPEQITGLKNVDRRGDLFSVGMSLYEAIAGRLPFDRNESGYIIQKKIVEEPFHDIRKFEPSLPKSLSRTIMKSIEKDPRKRFQSAAEMVAALDESNPLRKSSDAVVHLKYPHRSTTSFPVPDLKRKLYFLLFALTLMISLIVTAANTNVISSLLSGATFSKPKTLAEQIRQDKKDMPEKTAFPNRHVDESTSYNPPQPALGGNIWLQDQHTAFEKRLGQSIGTPYTEDSLSSLLTIDRSLPEVSSNDEIVAGATGSIRITSFPDQAEVLLNDTLLGLTPLFIDDIQTGAAEIMLRKEYHETLVMDVQILPLEITILEVELIPVQGALHLDITPPSDVYLNGEKVRTGTDSRVLLKVLATTHEVAVSNPAFGEWGRTVDVVPNDTISYTIDFTKKIQVSITAFNKEEQGMHAEILLDDAPTGIETPARIEIVPGLHTISVQADGYRVVEEVELQNYEKPPSSPLRFTLEEASRLKHPLIY